MNSPIIIEADLTFERRGRGAQRVASESKSEEDELPKGRLPKVTKLMAFAIRFEELLADEVVADYVDLARLSFVSRARISQIMNLRLLAPDIQEALLFAPEIRSGRDPISVREMQPIALTANWQSHEIRSFMGPVRRVHDSNGSEIAPDSDLGQWLAWAADGHFRGSRKKAPLEYAIDSGFHSLVKVLLDGGTMVGPIDGYCPMRMALEKRRIDIIQLLVEHGYDPKHVAMRDVLGTWDTSIMEYFIGAGCDFDADNPMAWALCNRIRTALPLLKKYGDKFPTFPEQANIALRHQCKEGNAKWVSLMLWAGADPLVPGEEDPDREPDLEDGGLCALGFAALYRHYELLGIKGMKPYLCKPDAVSILDF